MPVVAFAQTLRRTAVAAAVIACAKNEWHKHAVLACHSRPKTHIFVVVQLSWICSVQLSLHDLQLKRRVDEQTVTLLPDFLSQTLQDAVVLRVAGLVEQVQVFAGASAQVLCLPSVYTNFSYRNLETSKYQAFVLFTKYVTTRDGTGTHG